MEKIKMGCNILDWRCIIVNELVGSVVLSVLLATIIYFIIASKLKLGFDLTLVFSVPLLLILGLMFTGFSAIMAFSTVIIGVLLAWAIQKTLAK